MSFVDNLVNLYHAAIASRFLAPYKSLLYTILRPKHTTYDQRHRPLALSTVRHSFHVMASLTQHAQVTHLQEFEPIPLHFGRQVVERHERMNFLQFNHDIDPK